MFNSRSCQLVLGAGAMQTAGLKSISAKHLALSCQCLAAVIKLHPLLQTIFTLPVTPGRRALLIPEFERALKVSMLLAMSQLKHVIVLVLGMQRHVTNTWT